MLILLSRDTHDSDLSLLVKIVVPITSCLHVTALVVLRYCKR